MNRLLRKSSLWIAVAALVAVNVVAPARADIVSKADNNDVLSLGSSWVGGVAPGAGDIATWDAVLATGSRTTALGADVEWLGMAVPTSPGGNLALSSGNILTLGAEGITYVPNITLNVNCAVKLSADQTWSLTTGFFNVGAIDTQGHTLTVMGNSNKKFGAITGGGPILVQTGTLTFNTGSVPRAEDSAITVRSGATVNYDLHTGSKLLADSVTLSGGTLRSQGDSGGNTLDTITQSLKTDGGAGIVTLVPHSTRNIRLTPNSLVRVNNGVVLVRGTNLGQNTIASATANSANLSFGTAPALVGGGGAVESQNISIIPWALGDTSAAGGGLGFVTYDDASGIRPLDTALEYDATITGDTISNNNVSLALGSTTTTVNGPATINSLLLSGTTDGNLAGTGALTVSSGAVYAKLSGNGYAISKPLDFGSSRGVIGTSQWTNYQRGLSISGGIAGSGGLVIYNSPTASTGANGVSITTTTTYTGDTYILGGLYIRAANALPNGARAGDVYVFGDMGIIATVSPTINGLNGTGSITVYGTSAAPTLTVGSSGAGGNFSGSIGGKCGGIVKTGTGIQILSGSGSTFTWGPTRIQNGILEVVTLNSVSGGVGASSLGAPSSVANGNIILGNGTTTGQLTVVGTGETSDRVINLAGTTGGGVLDASGTGPLVMTSNFTATGAGSKTLTLQGSSTQANAIMGAIVNNSAANRTSLLKTGPGLWVLDGANTFTGGTTVHEGTLAGNGSLASDVTVATAAAIAPGTPGTVGTLTVNADVDFADGSVLKLDASGATADLLAVTGAVSGTGTVTVTPTIVGEGDEWLVMTAASIEPTFASTDAKVSLVKRAAGTQLWLTRTGSTMILIR